MNYWAELEDKRSLCICGHQKRHHHYLNLVGDNTGKCIARDCSCDIYKEKK